MLIYKAANWVLIFFMIKSEQRIYIFMVIKSTIDRRDKSQ